jgi:hypothetical protein
MTRLLVCGPRDYPDYWTVHEILDAMHRVNPITCLIEGGALGVDRFARAWAVKNGVPTDPCEVDHTLDGPWPAAGSRRNQRMMREKRPDRVLAFVATPPTKGTADMVRQAKRAGVPVREIGI